MLIPNLRSDLSQQVKMLSYTFSHHEVYIPTPFTNSRLVVICYFKAYDCGHHWYRTCQQKSWYRWPHNVFPLFAVIASYVAVAVDVIFSGRTLRKAVNGD